MSRFAVRCAGFACAVLVATLCGARAQERTVPDVVTRASVQYASQVKGLVGMQRHFNTVIDAGIVKHREASDSGMLMREGAFVEAKYYKIADDGRAFTTKQIDDRDAETNKGWSEGKIFFKEPYDPRFMADYRFAAAACADCRTGTVAVAFTSDLRDTQHGNGTLVIDEAAGRIEKTTYVPNALPPHATTGRVTETSTQALPDLWYVTRIEEVYEGRAFLLKGSATFIATFDHFQRFATVAEGETAVREGTIGVASNR